MAARPRSNPPPPPPRRSKPARSTSLPTSEVAKSELNAGIGLLAALVTAGLAGSNGEARRHVQSGAVRINDEPASDDRTTLGTATLLPEGVIKLSVGKKKHALLKPV